jgi:hypothetical protein
MERQIEEQEKIKEQIKQQIEENQQIMNNPTAGAPANQSIGKVKLETPHEIVVNTALEPDMKIKKNY